jgi:hypothetical protein
MNATLFRPFVVLGLALGCIVAAAGVAEGQIFRRPGGRTGQASPDSQPSRGVLQNRPFRAGQNPGGIFPGNNAPAAVTPGRSVPPPSQAQQPEVLVIVPLDEKPFEVEPTDVVRLTAQGIAGSEFSTKVEGPARLYRKVYVAGVSEGQLAIGGEEAEYEFAMTGVGKVKIDIIATFPNGPEPKVTTYRFDVVSPKQ